MYKNLLILFILINPMKGFSNESSFEVIDEFDNALSDISEIENSRFTEFAGLNWKNSGIIQLPDSNSTIAIPEGYSIVVGMEAKMAAELNGNIANDTIEAVVCDDSGEHLLIFVNEKSGYISIDDWAELNANLFLEQISKNTEEANIENQKKGLSELHVVGWIQEPILDRNTNTVYWAFEAKNHVENIVNSVAIRLGRYGFESIVCVADKELYRASGGALDVMLSAHTYDHGYRYQDFVSGDKVAEYGVAALVAASAGGKLIQVAGFLSIFKKLSVAVFALIGGFFYKIKNMFKRKK